MSKNRSVLIVDDHEGLAENFADVLGTAGFLTQTTLNAEDALGMFAHMDFDILITDQRLPGMNGTELIAMLRKQNVQIPILMISAYSDPQTVSKALQAGASEVLAKPVEAESLLGVVQRVLN